MTHTSGHPNPLCTVADISGRMVVAADITQPPMPLVSKTVIGICVVSVPSAFVAVNVTM